MEGEKRERDGRKKEVVVNEPQRVRRGEKFHFTLMMLIYIYFLKFIIR